VNPCPSYLSPSHLFVYSLTSWPFKGCERVWLSFKPRDLSAEATLPVFGDVDWNIVDLGLTVECNALTVTVDTDVNRGCLGLKEMLFYQCST
jgi:hypothetical protein